jgi:CheY-like chemotaxis protein
MDKRILLVDSDVFFSTNLSNALRAHGYATTICETSDDALRLAREQSPSAICVNLSARGFDPLALAQQLKSAEALRAIRLLGFCGHVEDEKAAQARAAGYHLVAPNSAMAMSLSQVIEKLMRDEG